MSTRTISIEVAAASLKDGRARLVDVREPGEYETVRVPGSLNVPLSVFEERMGTLPEGELMILCARGPRAFSAAEILAKRGRHAVVVDGGITEWIHRGQPAETGSRRVWPMERQVRLVAGLLVLLGVGLGMWVNPHFLWLAAFIGAGLTFSGLTGFCGMALILARCPWNR